MDVKNVNINPIIDPKIYNNTKIISISNFQHIEFQIDPKFELILQDQITTEIISKLISRSILPYHHVHVEGPSLAHFLPIYMETMNQKLDIKFILPLFNNTIKYIYNYEARYCNPLSILYNDIPFITDFKISVHLPLQNRINSLRNVLNLEPSNANYRKSNEISTLIDSNDLQRIIPQYSIQLPTINRQNSLNPLYNLIQNENIKERNHHLMNSDSLVDIKLTDTLINLPNLSILFNFNDKTPFSKLMLVNHDNEIQKFNEYFISNHLLQLNINQLFTPFNIKQLYNFNSKISQGQKDLLDNEDLSMIDHIIPYLSIEPILINSKSIESIENINEDIEHRNEKLGNDEEVEEVTDQLTFAFDLNFIDKQHQQDSIERSPLDYLTPIKSIESINEAFDNQNEQLSVENAEEVTDQITFAFDINFIDKQYQQNSIERSPLDYLTPNSKQIIDTNELYEDIECDFYFDSDSKDYSTREQNFQFYQTSN